MEQIRRQFFGESERASYPPIVNEEVAGNRRKEEPLSETWDSYVGKKYKQLSPEERRLRRRPLSREELEPTKNLTEQELREIMPEIDSETIERYKSIVEKLDTVIFERQQESKKDISVAAALVLSGTNKVILGATNFYRIGKSGYLDYSHAEENLFRNIDKIVELVAQETNWTPESGQPFPGIELVVTLEPCGGVRGKGNSKAHQEPCSIIILEEIQRLQEKLGFPVLTRIIIAEIDPAVHYAGLINLLDLGIDIDIIGPPHPNPDNEKFALRAFHAINDRSAKGRIAIASEQEQVFTGAQVCNDQVMNKIEDNVASKKLDFRKTVNGIFAQNYFWQDTKEHIRKEFIDQEIEELPEVLAFSKILEKYKEKGSERFVNELIWKIRKIQKDVAHSSSPNIEETIKQKMVETMADFQRWIYKLNIEEKNAKYCQEHNISPYFEIK